MNLSVRNPNSNLRRKSGRPKRPARSRLSYVAAVALIVLSTSGCSPSQQQPVPPAATTGTTTDGAGQAATPSAEPAQTPSDGSTSGKGTLPPAAPVGVRSKLTDAQIKEIGEYCPSVKSRIPGFDQALHEMSDAGAEMIYANRTSCDVVRVAVAEWIDFGSN